MEDTIRIRGAKEHNLRNIHLEIPRNKLIVFTGLSGSGKSTLAMDTIFAEGQRRYLESLSSYARQFLGQLQKPDVESIEGLSPTIAIDQKAASHNPRSTVGTVTEIYDYLRLLYARIGVPHCPTCHKPIRRLSLEQMVEKIFDDANENEPVVVMAPVVRQRKGEYQQLLTDLFKAGYSRARINGQTIQLPGQLRLERYKQQSIDIITDTVSVSLDNLSRLSEAIEAAIKLTDGLVRIVYANDNEVLFNQNLTCAEDGGSLPELEPRLFSFNSPQGACPTCDGLGVKRELDANLVMPDLTKTIAEGGVLPWSYRPHNYSGWFLRQICAYYHIPENIRLKDLTPSQRELILSGPETGPETIRVTWQSRNGDSQQFRLQFSGILGHLADRYQRTDSLAVREEIERYMAASPCPTCRGSRLRPDALLVTVGDKNIAELTAQSVGHGLAYLAELKLSQREERIAQRLLVEITNRLRFLNDVGLDYLTLDRAAMTLAGGEAQRIRLASQVGSALVGVLYILDEPTIGLHPRDNTRLISTLKHLRDLGNTVIVIEHDLETIEAADWLVDIGPGAGRLGGTIVVSGSIAEVKKSQQSLTGQYLSGTKKIPTPTHRRQNFNRQLTIVNAREHNLHNLTVSIPLGMFVCVTGVSGSGKSTLVNDVLFRAVSRQLYRTTDVPGKHDRIDGLDNIDKVINVDQAPIGRTPRSNPATYTGLFTPIRELFAQTAEAKRRGYGPGRFSFNVAGGRCDACNGDGLLKIEMQFLPDVYLPCDICKGARYNRETLQVGYKNKTIAEVLAMTVDEAVIFFAAHPGLHDKLQTLADVGLGYIQLGQAATTLSGGEAQRIKLASELSRRPTHRTLYILDEPTTGLHFEDIRKLLEMIQRLVDHGNSVIVIEHNLDVIKTADWIIDLGPEGGGGGGKLVAEGSPEEIAHRNDSYTGRYLRTML